ncbi:peptidase inhibitor family I36 protein [Cryptosporangium phraense]|uniref:peptidase inhibitor family I36 protein n=1 Tax=Cryptosporangium phraense TaxID=2593070 RepID=UPI001478801A|nr:peptidase inhibitor family I36 protein [Cryptosporangium phraense]
MKWSAALAAAVFALVMGLAPPANAAGGTPPAEKATLTSVTAAAPAAAPSGCSAGNLCFWNGTNFSDGPGELSGTNSNWQAFSHSTCTSTSGASYKTWNDCASSLYNNGTSCDARVWTDSGYHGSSYTMSRGQRITNLATFYPDAGDTFNNSISSNDWVC